MKRKLLITVLISTLLGCATSELTYNPREFDTNNYQKNVINAVDAADVLKDFDQSKIPVANMSTADFANLVQADVYFNQGGYTKAYAFYDQLARKYKDPRIIYKAIICLEHISSTPEQAAKLDELVALFIQVDPNSKIAKLFGIKVALATQDVAGAEEKVAGLITQNKANARVILLFITSMLSNDLPVATSSSIVQFADYVVTHYASYPEASLLATVGYAVANDEAKLTKQLKYIQITYPNWNIPLYWSVGVLSHYKYNATLISLLEKHLNQQTKSDTIIENAYIAALLNTQQITKAKLYLEGQLNNTQTNNVLINLGIIAAETGNYSQALTYLTQAQVNETTLNSAVTLVIAAIYDYQDNNQKAIQYYQQLVQLDPYLASIAKVMLLNNYLAIHDFSALSALLDQMAQAAHLDEKQAILFKSSYYISVNEYQKAYEILQAKFATYHIDKNYLYQYASMAALLKKTDQAIALYQQYLKVAPNEAMGYNDLAYVYAEQAHNYKLAKKYADKAFRLAPHDANVLDTLGWVYYKLGKYQQAYTYIKDSYQATPSAEGAAHLKAVYLALNKPELAKQVAVVAKSYLHPQVKLHLLHKSLALLMDLQYGTKIK